MRTDYLLIGTTKSSWWEQWWHDWVIQEVEPHNKLVLPTARAEDVDGRTRDFG
jgi:hypothetical protein